MYRIDAINRETSEVEVECYATFDTYREARSFADRRESEARACGWTWVVVRANR